MPRREPNRQSGRSQSPFRKLEAEPKGESPDTGRTVGGGCRGSREGRHQPGLDGTAGGVEPPEAADGRGFRNIDETLPTGIPGTGRTATPAASQSTVELEGRGGKLTIRLKNAPASYLATLSRELWESAS